MPHVASFRSIVCALDLSAGAHRVLYHAAGIAGAGGARLTLVHAGSHGGAVARQLQALYFDTVPYGASYLADPHVEVRAGSPAAVVLEVARDRAADLIVAGSSRRGRLSRLLLGSTSAALLQQTDRPMLLVPPGDIEVVSLTPDRVGLHFGAVLAAVDLTERNDAQLRLAATMAALSRQSLLLVTVTSDGDDHAAAQALHARAREAEVPPPAAAIVRRGRVAEEIARAAERERAGLVVMGLRSAARGTPGVIASAVLESGRALVLAVPGA